MQILKAELKFWMLGEFASLKSKHDGGVAEANQPNLLNVIANKVKQSFQLHNNGLPRRYAPRNDDGVVSNGLPRRYAPRNDLGRSMIEMLGVLAIIGVLTAGSMAGFSKAMSAYRWNMALGQWDELISVVEKYKSQLKINDGSQSSFNLLPILQATGELPDGMTAKNSRGETCANVKEFCYLTDTLKNRIEIYNHDTGYIGIRYLISKNNVEACRMFMNMAKTHHNIVHYLEFYNGKHAKHFYGDKRCFEAKENLCFKNLMVSQINEICKDNEIFREDEPTYFLMYWF